MNVELHFNSQAPWLTINPRNDTDQRLLNAFAGHGQQFVAEVVRRGSAYSDLSRDVLTIVLRPAPVPPPVMPADGVL